MSAGLQSFPVRRAWLHAVTREFQLWAGRIHEEAGLTVRRDIAALPPPESPLEALLLRGLVAELHDRLGRLQDSQDHQHANAVREAQRYLEKHYQEHITIGALSHVVGCSRTQLTRAFRTEIGRSLHDYLTEVRAQRGLDALRHSDDKIEVIAKMVGYRSKKDFYRVIRMTTGATPNQVRRSRRKPQQPRADRT